MAGRVIISKSASLDIDRIVLFNNTRNKSDRYSKRFVRSLYTFFKKLEKHPQLGRKTDVFNLFVLVWDKYYIFYTINSDIHVLRIYHHKEDTA